MSGDEYNSSRKRRRYDDWADDDNDSEEVEDSIHLTEMDAKNGRFHVDNFGNLLLKEKHRTNPDMPDNNNRNAVMKQFYVPGKNRTAWYGTLSNIAGVKKMVTLYFQGRPNSTPVCVTIADQNQDPVIAPPPGNSVTLPMIPYQRSSTFALPRKDGETREPMWKCANCGRFGHTLGDCVLPNFEGGDIDGCPICNTKDHLFDECHNQEYMNGEMIVRILWFRRGGKCQIRSDKEVYLLFKQFFEYEQGLGNDVKKYLECSPPWTRAFAFNVLGTDSNVKLLREFDYSDNPNQAIHADDTITFNKVLEGKLSSSYSVFLQKNGAAAEGKEKQKQKEKVQVKPEPTCDEPNPASYPTHS